MTIDYNLLPKTDETMWYCENCDSSIDLSWLLEDLVNECKSNEIYKEALYNSDIFDHGECDCCNHSIFFYEEQTKELKNFVKHILNERE
jgi:hypothetical protein